MNRGGPIERKTALTSNVPLARSGLGRNAGPKLPAKPKRSKPPRDTGPSKATVIAVLERDGYCCVRCGSALWGVRGFDYSIQHRRARGRGGSRRPDTNQPQNLIGLCGSAGGCNGFVESERAEAREFGWAIRQSEDPLLKPVAHFQYGFIYLWADGGYGSRPTFPTTTA